ncbi:MAG: hypothetical protein ABS882_05980 [Lysinibacillus sp.]
MINILRYDRSDQLMWEVQNFDVAYSVSGDEHDYVEQTSVRMRKFAQQQFEYPFYVYFESYFDAVAEILDETNLPITYKPSRRTVLTQIGRKCFQAEVPAFTVEIRHEADLNEVFEIWFRYAFDNLFWAITQSNSVTYKAGFPSITLQQNELMLLTEHDAYGFTVITNRAELQKEETLLRLLQSAFEEEVE